MRSGELPDRFSGEGKSSDEYGPRRGPYRIKIKRRIRIRRGRGKLDGDGGGVVLDLEVFDDAGDGFGDGELVGAEFDFRL